MTLKQAQRRWSKRRRQYAVGYIASGNLVYFARYGMKPVGEATVHPMTLKEAKAFLAEMPSRGAAIFRLMPMTIGGGRKR